MAKRGGRGSKEGRTTGDAPVGERFAALPWFRDEDGSRRVILITTRKTGRWSIPKGRPMKGKSPREAAAIEAYEEAGVRGRTRRALGEYVVATGVDASGHPSSLARVRVFSMRVRERLAAWPEQGQRRVADFSSAEAASLVTYPGLRGILERFAAEERGLKHVTGVSLTGAVEGAS